MRDNTVSRKRCKKCKKKWLHGALAGRWQIFEKQSPNLLFLQMRIQVFHCMDLHCGGEPARVLLSGCPPVKGSTPQEKRRWDVIEPHGFVFPGTSWKTWMRCVRYYSKNHEDIPARWTPMHLGINSCSEPKHPGATLRSIGRLRLHHCRAKQDLPLVLWT